MSGQYLNGKLECPTCGTILLAIPEEAAEDTPIKCAQCQTPRGTWGELRADFVKQSGSGVFDLNKGRIMHRDPVR